MNSSQSYHRRQQPEQRKAEPKTDFICKVKYTNTLPDLPFDPKFLECPFVSLDRFVQYKPTSLEKNFKFDLLTEPDLGVSIDLINPLTYQIPDIKIPHHSTDERLLEDESSVQNNLRRSQQHSKIVPWMRKTEYISTEFNRYGVSSDKSETKVGYSMRKKMEIEAVYKDRDAQISTINKTFDDAKKPVRVHYNKRNVTAVEEIPLFPDFDLWKYPFAQVIFDTDPLPFRKNENPELLMEHALIRGMMDNEGNQFVAYFAPTVESLAKRVEEEAEGRNFTEGEKYEYHIGREYNWTIKNKATKGYEQENYFFVFRDGGCYYNELETRVRLMRRGKGAAGRSTSILMVTHQPPTEPELRAMEIRRRELLFPYEHHEEDSNEEEEDEEMTEQRGSGDEQPKREDEAKSSRENSAAEMSDAVSDKQESDAEKSPKSTSSSNED